MRKESIKLKRSCKSRSVFSCRTKRKNNTNRRSNKIAKEVVVMADVRMFECDAKILEGTGRQEYGTDEKEEF